MKSYCLLCVSVLATFILLTFKAMTQTDTLILQPGPADGKDALIRDDYPTSSYGSDVNFTSNAWTVLGNPCILRSLISFNLSPIPATAIVISARLSLFCNNNSGIYQLQYGDNESYLLKVTQPWDENLVTWINQPGYTFENAVLLTASTYTNQDYPDIDVTAPVRDMVADPSSNYGWLLRLTTEELYRSMVFASSDNPVVEWRPTLTVIYQDCPSPAAYFQYNVLFPDVHFFDSSSSATSWYWYFVDGYFSSLRNPVHQYDTSGVYYACLEITDSCGSDIYCDSVFYCDPPNTSFSYTVNEHFVHFHDSSDHSLSRFWDFGDGFYSDLSDPVHYYINPGKYCVCLTSATCISQVFCDSVVIQISGIHELGHDLLRVFPNPAADKTFIECIELNNSEDIWISITDMHGTVLKRELLDHHPLQSSFEIKLTCLEPGLYVISITSGTFSGVKRLIIL